MTKPATPKRSFETPTSPNPITLAQRLVDDPLEGEVRVLLANLNDTSGTVMRVLPTGPRN